VSRRRRAVALTVLSVLLGALAASEVSRREAALERRIGPTVPVVVTRVDLPAGALLRPAVLAVRQVPMRFAPAAAFRRPGQLGGLTAAIAIPRGTDLAAALVRDPAAVALDEAQSAGAPGNLRPGQRVAEITARGDARLLGPGSRVDLLVTRETADGSGGTTLALEDAEVIAAAPAGPEDRGGGGGDAGGADASPRVALSLRVTLRQAVTLAAAQNFAKELRVLVRADGDRARGAQGLTVRDG
jgi:pilus assembly protein CpaB